MKIDRTKIEKICDQAQLRLEARERIWGGINEPYELFIAAGESSPPHFRYQRFGIEPTDFPLGCIVTMTWLFKDEDDMILGIPAFFEKNHDANLEPEARKQARINRCKADAMKFLENRKRARKKLRMH